MIDSVLRFEKSIHSGDAVQRAIYRLSDRISCDVSARGSVFECHIHMNVESQGEADELLAAFRNEVLDQTLRERIRDETRDARHLILAMAFSETGLVDQAGD